MELKADPQRPFAVRGFHLDLRVQVITPEALRALIDRLAELRFNLLILEWEATFPYERHPTISNRYAYSPEKVSELVHYAIERGLEVVPLQQCFGHVEYILRHPRYAHLRESRDLLSQVCPCRIEASRNLFSELFEDLIAYHPGRYFHIGGDETRLLGHCPMCAKVVEEKGVSFLYGTYLREMIALVRKLGRIPMLWADIILRHPEQADLLPRDAIFIDWNYGWPTNRFGESEPLQRLGFQFWGATALRSNPDNYALTCWERHLRNFREFIPFSRQRGDEGIILTSWSTSGEYDYFQDSEGHVAEIIPRRRVYPLSGFDLLLKAFHDSVFGDPLIPSASLVRQYATTHFGLSPSDAETLVSILLRPRMELAAKSPPVDVVERAQAEEQQLAAIHPESNEKDWRHFVLMARLEAHHLALRQIEDESQNPKFDRGRRGALSARLRPLIEATEALDNEFRKLQRGYLPDNEIEEEIRYRRHFFDDLHTRLSR